MFDTVRLVGAGPVVGHVADRLDRRVEWTILQTGSAGHSGRVKNLSVTVSPNRLNVRGSLTGFLREMGWDGLHPTRQDVRAARSMLEARLGTDLGQAAVWRLDVFADLALSSEPSCYLPLLTTKDRFQRSSYDGTSVQFGVKHRQLAFYDKAAEQERTVTGGLLRYEMRFLKRLTWQMGTPLTFADLHEPTLWVACADKWIREYESVVKQGEYHLPTGEYSPNEYHTLLAAMAVGPGELIELHKRQKKAGHITKSKYDTARKNILKALTNPVFASPSIYVEELDTAVSDAARLMRDAAV